MSGPDQGFGSGPRSGAGVRSQFPDQGQMLGVEVRCRDRVSNWVKGGIPRSDQKLGLGSSLGTSVGSRPGSGIRVES